MRCPRFNITMTVQSCINRQENAGGRIGNPVAINRGCLHCETGVLARQGKLNDDDMDQITRNIKIPDIGETIRQINSRSLNRTNKVQNDGEKKNMKSKKEAGPVPEGMKWCPGCKKFKPANKENFNLNKNSPDGFYSYCRPCRSKIQKDARLKKSGKLPEKPEKPDVPVPFGPIYPKDKRLKVESKSQKPAIIRQVALNLDFRKFPDVIDKIAAIAAQELRSPENQAVWMLKLLVGGESK